MTRAVCLALLAVLCVCAAPTYAADEYGPEKRSELPMDLDGASTTTNVVVHYRTSGADAVSPAEAATVNEATEQALAKFVELGFPKPVDDGDGHVDVYYYSLVRPSLHGVARGEGQIANNARPGWIMLNTDYDKPLQTVKHELFHLVQLAIAARGRETWFSESTASWARWQVDDPPAENFEYRKNYAAPLNCAPGGDGVCADATRGYSSWLFFSIFDAGFVRDLLGRIAALSADGGTHGFDALTAELAERGTTLEAALLELGTRMVQGSLPYPNSQPLLPVTALTLAPPATGETSAPTNVVVDHAALQFAALAPTGSCETVPLALDLSGPVENVAVSFVQRGGDATPLSAGETVVTWKPCEANPADIVFANGTADADGQAFAITGRVAGVPVLSALKARHKGKRVLVTVRSSAPGRLSVALKPGVKRTIALKAGANRVLLPAPKAKRTKITVTPSVGDFTGAKLSTRVRLKTKR